MLLRWLVNNYLRDAAQGKAREVIADVLQRPPPPATAESSSNPRPAAPDSQGLISEPRTLDPEPSSPDDFLPCDVIDNHQCQRWLGSQDLQRHVGEVGEEGLQCWPTTR